MCRGTRKNEGARTNFPALVYNSVPVNPKHPTSTRWRHVDCHIIFVEARRQQQCEDEDRLPLTIQQKATAHDLTLLKLDTYMRSLMTIKLFHNPCCRRPHKQRRQSRPIEAFLIGVARFRYGSSKRYYRRLNL